MRALIRRQTRWRLGLQAVLAAGTVGLLILLLLVVGVFQYVALQTFLHQQLSSSLHGQARYAISGRGRPESATSDPAALARDASSPDVRAGVVDDAGGLLGLGPSGPRNLTWIQPAPADTGRAAGKSPNPDYWLLDSPDGGVLAVAVPVGRDAAAGKILVLEGSLAPTETILRGDLGIYIAGSAVAILLGAILSALFTGRALQRLHRVALTATAIAAGDLDQRAQIAGSDEVAALGTAFDDMVGRLQSEIGNQEASASALRRFLADVSHELRTPIALLRGNLDILRRGAASEPDDLALSIDDMHRAAVRMSRLVDDLLTLVRIEQGKRPEVVAVEVEVASLLQETARAARQIAEGRPIEVESAPTLQVTGDRDALIRILLNLIENAVRYTPPGSPITIRATAEHDATVIIEVIDCGVGIAVDDQPHIFERFYRGQQPGSTSNGTGLGLAISSALAQGQGGTLTVRSTRGEGSTFVLTLPVARPVLAHGPVIRTSR